MTQDFMFHFVRFLQATITTATCVLPSDARINGYVTKLNWKYGAEWPNETLTFCQVALKLVQASLDPCVNFDEEMVMKELSEKHKLFAASLSPINRHLQELNLEALERFLSGELVYG